MTQAAQTRRVTDAPNVRTSVIVIRLWLERDHELPLRARLTRTDHDEEQTSLSVSTADQACDVVRAWFEQFAAGPRDSR